MNLFSFGVLVVGGLVLSLSSAYGISLSAELSPNERAELSSRLKSFYRGTPASMSHVPPSYDVRTGKRVVLHPELGIPSHNGPNEGEMNAGARATPEFRRYYCEQFLKRHFPGLDCGEHTDALEQARHNLSSLTDTWISDEMLIRSLDELPQKGTLEGGYWSGSYYPTRWGLTSWRYAIADEYETYEEAVNAYQQPQEWRDLVDGSLWGALDDELAEAIERWSPAEKYDLSVGDEELTLTRQQKEEGRRYLGQDGKIPLWFGICHGWAPASLFVPAPTRPVTATGARGVKVKWYPHDVRAMATLAWANGDFSANYVGGRCNPKDPKRYPNGRLSDPNCFDSNPSVFHLALGNLIGKARVPFIMDIVFDQSVWNQPILSYELEYFNPLDSDEKSSNWEAVAVDYNDDFKKGDRFQTPLTRGKHGDGGDYDDSGIKKVVGVLATVVYLDEDGPQFGAEVVSPATVRKTYTYDLELYEREGRLIADGGEWHSNAHPDFLWVPEKGSIASTRYDQIPFSFSLEKEAGEPVGRLASATSARERAPLCRVLKVLVEAAGGDSAEYRCP